MNEFLTLKTLGIAAAIILPFWNIPLIWRVLKRKSSRDISLAWVVGVEVCILAMLPSALCSVDPAFKALGIINAIFFTCVFVTVLIYHREDQNPAAKTEDSF